MIGALDGPMAPLRALLAKLAAKTTAATAPHKPREGTKQEAVITLFRRDVPASEEGHQRLHAGA